MTVVYLILRSEKSLSIENDYSLSNTKLITNDSKATVSALFFAIFIFSMHFPVKFYAEVCVLYGTVFATIYGFKMCSNYRQSRNEDNIRQMIDDAIFEFKHTASSLMGKVLSSIENDAKNFDEKQFSEEIKFERVVVLESFDRLSGDLCTRLLLELGLVRSQVAGKSNEAVFAAMQKAVDKIFHEETEKMYVKYIDIYQRLNDRFTDVKKRLATSQQ